MIRLNRSIRPLGAVLLAGGVLVACSGGGGGGGGGGGAGPQFGTVSGQVTVGTAGLSGVAVSAAGAGTATTDAGGNFTIANVPTGSPNVSITVPAGYITANAGDATSRAVTVTAGQTATTSFALKRGVQVSAAGTSFSPDGLSITPGTTVRWVNNGGGAHTVTPDAGAPAGAWPSAQLPAEAAFEHTFTSVGTYPYHCIPHQGAGMTGNVTVALAGPSPSGTQPGTPGYP